MAAKAAASHTGALVGNDDVLDVAFRRAGVIRVKYVSELFNIAEVLAKQPRPKGPKLAIVTCAGGPAVLATDALIEAGGQLANFPRRRSRNSIRCYRSIGVMAIRSTSWAMPARSAMHGALRSLPRRLSVTGCW